MVVAVLLLAVSGALWLGWHSYLGDSTDPSQRAERTGAEPPEVYTFTEAWPGGDRVTRIGSDEARIELD